MKSLERNSDNDDGTYAAIIRANTPRLQVPEDRAGELGNIAMIGLQRQKLRGQIEQKRMVRS